MAQTNGTAALLRRYEDLNPYVRPMGAPVQFIRHDEPRPDGAPGPRAIGAAICAGAQALLQGAVPDDYVAATCKHARSEAPAARGAILSTRIIAALILRLYALEQAREQTNGGGQ
jgi:hypothetical protein